jgi:hypothetical protein
MRVILGLLGVMVVAGCGSTTGPDTTPAPTGQAQVQEQQKKELTKAQQDSARMENLIADCMKAQGFQYIAHPLSFDEGALELNVGGRDPSQVPYEKLKAYRQKYGYAIYGRDVFPTDPAVGNTPRPPNPNNAIRDGLDPARREAYDKALNGGSLTMEKAKKREVGDGGCASKASAEVYPANNQSKPDPAKEAEFRQLMQAFQTDPKLLQASQAYGSCLRKAGFEVPSTKPGVIEITVQQSVLKERSEKPEKIDAAVAQQGLQTEIQKSLTDLDCGKDYEVLAKPHMEKLLGHGGGAG